MRNKNLDRSSSLFWENSSKAWYANSQAAFTSMVVDSQKISGRKEPSKELDDEKVSVPRDERANPMKFPSIKKNID